MSFESAAGDVSALNARIRAREKTRARPLVELDRGAITRKATRRGDEGVELELDDVVGIKLFF